jgi:hypothetical protein
MKMTPRQQKHPHTKQSVFRQSSSSVVRSGTWTKEAGEDI